ncbi:MAG: metal-dependent transcriptional regulator [Spirochaetales bacterium]|nr:metal-dependent transcriptional regulator [Spirochaetales bacterium]
MELTASLEHYLETVFLLEKEHRVARVKAISESMGVSMASVVSAMKKLSAKGLVNYEKKAYITLSEKGKRTAAGLVNRHNTIQDFLEKILHVPADSAHEQADKLGAHIEQDTVRKLFLLTENLKSEDRRELA